MKKTMKMSFWLVGEPSEEESKSLSGLRFEKIKAKNFTDLGRENLKFKLSFGIWAQQIPKDNFLKYMLKCIMMKYQNSKTKSFQKSVRKKLPSKEPLLLWSWLLISSNESKKIFISTVMGEYHQSRHLQEKKKRWEQAFAKWNSKEWNSGTK